MRRLPVRESLRMRRSWIAAAGVLLVSAGCSEDASPLGVRLADDRTIRLLTTCVVDGDPTAEVEEDAEAVRISNVAGRTDDSECLSGLDISLKEPLGDRILIVEGAEWVGRSPDCPFGEFGPDDQADVNPACAPLP